MSDEIIVAIYDTPAHAKLAAADLREAGVPEAAIGVHVGTFAGPDTTTAPSSLPRQPGYWTELFGGSPDHDTSVYERSVNEGGSVITVQAAEAVVERVMSIVESHAPIDIDERATRYGGELAPTAAGSRVVNRGTSRIRRFVAES